MKKLIFILFILPVQLFALSHNYYISNSGNDGNVGTSSGSAWATISKLNANWGVIGAGDSILFEKGGTFYGTITIGSSGASGNQLKIGAYGAGANPIITGFTTITSGWTNEGGGIYSKVITSAALTNMVTIDGVQYGMGRYPDLATGYLTYQSFSTNVSITSSSLSGTPNYTGAEVVIKKTDWIIDRNTITSQSTGTLNYTTLGYGSNGTNNYGFFLQNYLGSLTTYGEWYHDYAGTGKLYVYFGGSGPTGHSVNVATVSKLITNAGYDYITIDGLSLQGSISDGIAYTSTTDNLIIRNCDVLFIGMKGINIAAGATGLISNNTVKSCNHTAISSDANTEITGNNIRDINSIVGQYLGAGGVTSAIRVIGNGAFVHNNNIKNIGYNGITITNTGASIVQNNFIDSTLITQDDGGGIYTSAADASVRLFDGNIITNVIGNTDGTTHGGTSRSASIYLDESAANVTVTNNSIANTANGIKVHISNNNTLKYNKIYNGGNGVFLQNNQGSSGIFNSVMTGNTIVAKTTGQFTLQLTSNLNDLASFGTFDSNYYARPVDDNLSITIYQPSIGQVNKALSTWQSFSSQDVHSYKSPAWWGTTSSNLRFDYNATVSAVVVNFGGFNQLGIDGVTTYPGSVTLQPYTSLITYKGTAITHTSPTANAGTYSAITLPVNTVNLTGSGIAYDGATITGYLWSGSGATFSNSAISNPVVTFSTSGTKAVTLTVTDSMSATGSNTTNITVNPAIIPPPPANQTFKTNLIFKKYP